MEPITPEVVAAHNLTHEEFERIKSLLGREPNLVELGIFSVMWSEHCSYKSSRIHLRRLPTTGERIIVPPGENAGIVDVGDGWCAAFKIESHNHPSFIEPFQGAATGVGGILRDVFTMGARPIASMNSLRFGSLDHPKHGRRNRSLLAGVVGGIAHYGNAFGVATVGGEVAFDDAYSLNPLVNAFALGLVSRIKSSLAKPLALAIRFFTSAPRPDATAFTEPRWLQRSLTKRHWKNVPLCRSAIPSLRNCFSKHASKRCAAEPLRVFRTWAPRVSHRLRVKWQRAQAPGIELNLSLVPQREDGMTAYEMLLSESQERMLIVAHSGREREVIDIFRKWDLDAVVIGRVREGTNMRVIHKGETVADIPVSFLTDEAPLYERADDASPKSKVQSPKSGKIKSEDPQVAKVTKHKHLNDRRRLLKLLASPNLASKQYVYRQYDHMVRTNTAVLPGADAAVVRIKETRRALAMTLDGNGRYCAANPREGAKLIVAEAARNVVCVGARPLAITNCLNFASPERPEVMWSFSEVIDGMAEACRAFNTPVVSGNVSFYNETEGRGILPTPVIGMIGLVEDVRRVVQPGFKKEGDVDRSAWSTADDLSISEYRSAVEGISTSE